MDTSKTKWIGRVGNDPQAFYWERRDGSEGGELWLDTDTKQIIDFDGAFDLPCYIKNELIAQGYVPDWSDK